MTMAY